jgi:hypothetical protein
LKKNNDLKIKKELDTVYIDSSGKRHLDYMEARCAETQILMCRERKLQQKQRIMKITELIMQVLKSKNWGVYYKIQPIQPLETQDGSALYKVNQVDEHEIEKVIEEALAWDTTETNPISNQSKNSTTG